MNRRQLTSDVRLKESRQYRVVGTLDFTHLLQDMIGDLTGAISAHRSGAVFRRSESPCRLGNSGWRDALVCGIFGNLKAGRPIEDGIENTTSGPAAGATVVSENSNPGGFHDSPASPRSSSAIVDGEPATRPAIINDHLQGKLVRRPSGELGSH